MNNSYNNNQQQQQQQQQSYYSSNNNSNNGNRYQNYQQHRGLGSNNKVLNVAEKPSMAKAIAGILSDNRCNVRTTSSKVSSYLSRSSLLLPLHSKCPNLNKFKLSINSSTYLISIDAFVVQSLL